MNYIRIMAAIVIALALSTLARAAEPGQTQVITGATVVDLDGGEPLRGSPDWYLARRESVGRQHWEALKMVIEEGVNIALGSDQHPHEPNDGTTATVHEAEYYFEAGMTPLQALRAATIEPARMLGADELTGSLEVGKAADIIAVTGDPTADISVLRDIVFVMKDGFVYRNDMH